MSIPGSANPLLLKSAGSSQYLVTRSLRFHASDSAYLSRTPASAGNRKTWTWAGWVKRGKLDTNAYYTLFGAPPSGGVTSCINIPDSNTGNGVLEIKQYISAYDYRLVTAQVFRDPSAWYHIVVAFDTTQATASDRIKVYVNGAQITSFSTATYPTQNFDGSTNNNISHDIGRDGGYGRYWDGLLADVFFIDGQALNPSSFTEVSATTGQLIPKKYSGPTPTGNSFWLPFSDNSAATATTLGKDGFLLGNNWTPNNLSVVDVPARGYYTGASNYLDAALDGIFGNSAATDAAYTATFTPPIPYSTLFIVYGNMANGQLGNPASGAQLSINGSAVSATGTYGTSPYSASYNKYYSTTTPGTLSSLGMSAGVSGSHQSGIYEVYVNGSLLVKTPASSNDSLVDTPTSYGTDTGAGGEVRGNYATLNPLVNFNGSTLSNGNLDITCVAVANQWRTQKGGWGFYGGKFYFEATLNAGPPPGGSAVGIGRITLPHSGNLYPGQSGGSYAYGSDGAKVDSGSISAVWSTWTAGDIIGVATDLTAGTVAFYKNGTLQGSMTGLDTTLIYEALVGGAGSTASQYSLNFGQRPFAYTAPSGFKALCDTNLPVPVVAKPSTVFDTKLWTGNGSGQTISGLGFSPDLVWLKARNQAYSHQVYDQIRGALKILRSNTTEAEITATSDLTAFNSNGFSLGFDAGSNQNGTTYAAWCWDAGTSTVTNTQGSITSQVRANASAGFSIVTYTAGSTNATVGHGLNVAPELILCKSRSNAITWVVYHKSLGKDAYLFLNGTDAAGTGATNYWGTAGPTSTTFGLATSGYANNSGNMVAYCFAPVAGYSSFGSYTGNGSADGPFVYCNFRPRWVMVKNTASGSINNWVVLDTARDESNTSIKRLYPNTSQAEDAVGGAMADLLSSGFKVRTTNGDWNNNNQVYIYAAFAESPFAYARAR